MEQPGVFRPLLVFRPKPNIILFGEVASGPVTVTASADIVFSATVLTTLTTENSASSTIIFGGTATGAGNAPTAVTGVTATARLAGVTIAAGGAVTVGILGVTGTISLGSALAGVDQTPTPSGVSATSSIGVFTVEIAAASVSITLQGLSAIAQIANPNIWSAVGIGSNAIWTDIDV